MNIDLEPPSMREELDRKAYECLERLARQHEQGKLGLEGLQVGIRSVWDVISGLSSHEIADLATQMHKEVGYTPPKIARVFRNIDEGDFACALEWTPGGRRVTVLKKSGKVEAYDYETESEAKARFSLLGDRLASQYEEWA